MRISTRENSEYSLLARIIFWAQKLKYGESLNPSKVWARSPALLYGLQVFYRALDRRGSPLEPSLRSLVGVKVSQINHCKFCVDIGQATLQKRGVSQEKVAAVSNHQEASVFSDRERAALDYAEVMTKSDLRVDDVLFNRVKAQFSEEEIVELTAFIAFQNMSSKFNSALDVPPQGFCQLPQTRRP